MRLDISSRSLESDMRGKDNFFACQESCKKYGFDFGVQLHNTASEDIVKFVTSKEVLVSAHAPICGEYSLNLATKENLDWVFQSFQDNYNSFKTWDIDISVFHGFAMTDMVIKRMKTQSDYSKNLSALNRKDLRLVQESAINRDFTQSDEYLERLIILRNNLQTLRDKFQDIIFCIENDLPVYGYAGMTLQDLITLKHPICIDFGHLWCSSLALDFDFYQELEIGLDSGLTKMIHFHNSLMTNKMDKKDLADGHLNLNVEYDMDLRRSFKLLEKYNINYLVLEITDCNPKDITKIAEFMNL